MISIYGIPDATPEELERQRHDRERGIVRFHQTTYLEYNIPEALEEELSDIIDKRISKFEQKCQCEDYKKNRKK